MGNRFAVPRQPESERELGLAAGQFAAAAEKGPKELVKLEERYVCNTGIIINMALALIITEHRMSALRAVLSSGLDLQIPLQMQTPNFVRFVAPGELVGALPARPQYVLAQMQWSAEHDEYCVKLVQALADKYGSSKVSLGPVACQLARANCCQAYQALVTSPMYWTSWNDRPPAVPASIPADLHPLVSTQACCRAILDAIASGAPFDPRVVAALPKHERYFRWSAFQNFIRTDALNIKTLTNLTPEQFAVLVRARVDKYNPEFMDSAVARYCRSPGDAERRAVALCIKLGLDWGQFLLRNPQFAARYRAPPLPLPGGAPDKPPPYESL